MNNTLYKNLIDSFHELEKKDFNAISNIIDKRLKGDNIVLISNDPYLSTLIFTSLIRYYGINIHILNPAEDITELQRLLYVINPGCAITTNPDLQEELVFVRIILIDGNTISKEETCSVEHFDDIDFTIISYSPFPTKIYNVSSGMFYVMVKAFIQDLIKLNLIEVEEHGLIPFTSNNPDYLLYWIAIKLSGVRVLPTTEETYFVLQNRKSYMSRNYAKTLFIPKKEFLDIWEKEIISIFEHKFIFNSCHKRKWLVNILIRKRLKLLFKGFSNVLIIGSLDNVYMINVLKNLSFIKFYTIFPIQSALFYGPISHSLESIVLSSNTFRQCILHECLNNKICLTQIKSPIYVLSYRLFHPNNEIIYNLTDTYNRYVESNIIKKDGDHEKHYFLIGNAGNAFEIENTYIFPETLEKIINSYSFIRNCALLTFNKKLILIVHPNMNILDSNRINYKMFHNIIQKQFDILNKKLPEFHKIQGFVITTSLIEQNRNGDIVRFPFNYCNKFKWSG